MYEKGQVIVKDEGIHIPSMDIGGIEQARLLISDLWAAINKLDGDKWLSR